MFGVNVCVRMNNCIVYSYSLIIITTEIYYLNTQTAEERKRGKKMLLVQ